MGDEATFAALEPALPATAAAPAAKRAGQGAGGVKAMPSGGHCDRQTAEQAVRLARPLLEAALADPTMGQSGVLAIVVMDPTRPAGQWEFEEAILYEQALGRERGRWDADYFRFARAKARVSWRTQRDTAAVCALAPHLLGPEDTALWGSVAVDGIVVAISGLEPAFDEAFSGVIAMCLRGLVKARAAQR